MNLNPAQATQPRFTTLDEFVQQYLLAVARYGEEDFRWCRQWWKHSAAVVQLDALWRSFEGYAVEPDAWAMAVWWRDYYHPIWREVTRANGTFSRCNDQAGTHEQGRRRTTEHPPRRSFRQR